MVKKLIYADFRKNNSIFTAAISAAYKNSGITARKPRANTAETSGRDGAPCSAATKRSSRLAVIVAQESAEPSSQLVLLGLASAANDRIDSSNPILNPKGSIH